jgi:hypothetical protein
LLLLVIPAQAGIHGRETIEEQRPWIPAYAGMTASNLTLSDLEMGSGQPKSHAAVA